MSECGFFRIHVFPYKDRIVDSALIREYAVGENQYSGIFYLVNNSSVIGQKGESQNGCYKKTKHAKLSGKEQFLPLHTHTCVRIRG